MIVGRTDRCVESSYRGKINTSTIAQKQNDMQEVSTFVTYKLIGHYFTARAEHRRT